MKTKLSRFLPISLALAIAVSASAPSAVLARSVSSIKGADEKEFNNPVSRCDTPAMRKLHAQNLSVMKKDIDAAGDRVGDEAIKAYSDKLDLIWEAMTEPYCGYGSMGITAAKKSYNKSVSRARSQFLAETKKVKASLKN